MTHNHNLPHSDMPEITDAPDAARVRKKDFQKKYAHLNAVPLDKGFSIEGQKSKWTYVIAEFNKESGKTIKIKQTKEGLFAVRTV